jgi:hypothetical protein
MVGFHQLGRDAAAGPWIVLLATKSDADWNLGCSVFSAGDNLSGIDSCNKWTV